MIQREKVQKLAYELYEKNGRREGRDLLDWLAAEQILRFQQLILPERGDAGEEEVGLLEYKPLAAAAAAPEPREKPRARPRKVS
jgi:hypothetical protein